MASQDGRVRSSSSRSSCNVIHCTGLSMAATVTASISYFDRRSWRVRAAVVSAGCTEGWCTRSLVETPSTMAVRHRNPGLYRGFGAHVAPTDGVVVDVPGGEADHAVATDRPDAPAIAADVPDPRGVLR